MFNFLGDIGQGLEQFLSQFHFIRPWWLVAFVPMFFLLWLRWREDAKPKWKDLLPEHLRKALTIGDTGWKKQLPLKLLMVIVALAIIVCAGPTWQRASSPFGEDKASMLVVLDNTESMLSKDLPPSRLERSKQKIRDLLSMRNGGNTGLVVYSGSAHVAMPVTQDVKVFDPFLAAIEPSIMPQQGKFAEQALPLIDLQLQEQPGSSVLLVTDGVNEKTIEEYRDFFNNKPYQLLILVPGNSDSGRSSKDPVDFASLKRLASETGGYLVEVTVDDSDIRQLDRFVERNMQMNGESSMPWKDMGYGLLYAIVGIMLLWFRKGWLVQWCVVIALSGSAVVFNPVQAQPVSSVAEQATTVVEVTKWDKVEQWWWDLWLTPDQQGQRWLNKKEYLKAATHFSDPLRKGVAYYYATEYKLAHSAFIQLQNSEDEYQKDLGLYFSATALARQREYLAARNLLQDLSKKETLDAQLRVDVENNLQALSDIVEEINRVSESQAGTTDGPEESFELDEDKPRTADGADEETVAELMLKETLNANEILGSEELADKWLKRVEADPKYFLRAKFQIQLRESATEVTNND